MRRHEYRRAALLNHYAVVFLPIVMGSSCCGEYVPQQGRKEQPIDSRVRIVGPHYLCRSLDPGPLPCATKRHGAAPGAPNVVQLVGASAHDESNNVAPVRWMSQHPGVDYGGMRCSITARSRDYA